MLVITIGAWQRCIMKDILQYTWDIAKMLKVSRYTWFDPTAASARCTILNHRMQFSRVTTKFTSSSVFLFVKLYTCIGMFLFCYQIIYYEKWHRLSISFSCVLSTLKWYCIVMIVTCGMQIRSLCCSSFPRLKTDSPLSTVCTCRLLRCRCNGASSVSVTSWRRCPRVLILAVNQYVLQSQVVCDA